MLAGFHRCPQAVIREDEDGEGLVVRFRMNRAQQNMKCIIHHAEFGEVGRHAVNPNMLKGEVAA